MERKLDILFLTNYFPPESNAPAIRTYEHAKRWVRQGHKVKVVCTCPNHPAGKPFQGYTNGFMQRENMDGIEVVRLWSLLAANKGVRRRTASYLSFGISAVVYALFTKQPDVLVATSPQFFCGIAGALVRRLRKIPFVLEIRDIWPESIQAVGAVDNSFLFSLLSKLERWMYRAGDKIITVGEGYKAILLRKGVDEAKVAVITNGIDFELFTPEACTSRRDLFHLPEDRFILAYIGTVGMAHDVDIMRRAALLAHRGGFSHFYFLIVGDGAEREVLQDRIRENALDNIRVVPHIPRNAIPTLLASVDAALVHLKKAELFATVLPSKLFEPMASSTPIILGVKGEAERICREANAGIAIEPQNEDELLSALVKLQKDPKQATRLGSQGLCYVKQHYDRDKNAQRFLDEMLRVVERGRP